jgi:pyruvate-formate lyase
VSYRLIEGLITPITSEIELECVSTAVHQSSNEVSIHLKTALTLFSNRENPDYRNSIKEAITAVECCMRQRTGKKNLNFNSALQSLKLKLPKDLQDGFKNLYTYTNIEETGIRHALIEDTHQPTQAEAQYFLIVCSAFINYLTSIQAKPQSP